VSDTKVRKIVPTEEYSSKTLKHKVKREEIVVCHSCGGWGAITNGHNGEWEQCQTCEGTGEEYK